MRSRSCPCRVCSGVLVTGCPSRGGRCHGQGAVERPYTRHLMRAWSITSRLTLSRPTYYRIIMANSPSQ
ncbi:hypothetical protein BD311DRAFT_745672 [Dichomitus squalens]|uniref:Uncharacterized protein n=1 Tax=Dichomitus squalens TaxID=114155 RepID=A0A4V2K237_9APHY|nr:hypothetical protein BD311DRAFT_745672 [Dichomitus squalens]